MVRKKSIGTWMLSRKPGPERRRRRRRRVAQKRQQYSCSRRLGADTCIQTRSGERGAKGGLCLECKATNTGNGVKFNVGTTIWLQQCLQVASRWIDRYQHETSKRRNSVPDSDSDVDDHVSLDDATFSASFRHLSHTSQPSPHHITRLDTAATRKALTLYQARFLIRRTIYLIRTHPCLKLLVLML
ncbi:hypothetical protein PHSY_002077 [Pseudozyma hubeiensis SY62]|uniref:Uncharacterized protein n=1 Tax=Pseudozyma hubeiensis (strain SY62) TaxID=1305764 RepID=R9P8T9_PSEHS|nr:hypothetical protein PHSY_002077 [Pseudozyma hubeiensis SY62]GAC94505.1 hypothetical protein PHSY_002077 [Pseudozyma hubeiensis SY62]